MGPRPPAGIVSRWVRAVVGLTVGVAIGLAPYLGTKKVPLFQSLLEMIPDAIRDSTIPLSAACMGLVAVAVQWYGGEHISAKALRKGFGIALAAAVATLMIFMWVHATYVIKVSAEGGNRTSSFVIGTARQPSCGCPATVSDEECINGLTWRPAAIAQCWGDPAIRRASLLVRGSYILATSAFGALVGFLVLRSGVRRR